MNDPATHDEARPINFIRQIVESDNASRKWGTWPDGTPRVHTRFPPEPNGYLHIGHAKSICLNYGLARDYAGKFNLRFDDTNPEKEEQEYVDSIIADVKWLGADWQDRLLFASDYFNQMFAFAEELVNKGKAYVCDLSADEVRATRGTATTPGTPSPFRDRPPAESLDLLRRMKAGEFPEGSRTLRAKIDMASPNFNLRDPVMYRIVHAAHHRTGTTWHIYPSYDWAHGLEDSIEGITHSICTLEFENHRPLYDWFLDSINIGRHLPGGSGPYGPAIAHPQQIEFAKFRPTYTILSKRNLLKMVEAGVVDGWDDPRMPTISGLRRRGYTPESLWALCEDVGVTKFESFIDMVRVENAVRDDLNKRAPRRMAVLRPLRVVIENYPEGQTEELDAVNNPEDAAAGTRKVPFSRVLFIERDDFMEDPPKKFFRLSPGKEVRLRYAYFITCTGVVKDAATGEITEIRCTYDPATRGGDAPDGRKVKATLHWVSAAHAVEAEVRLYDRLFTAEHPGERTGNFMDDLNPASMETIARASVEPSVAEDMRRAAFGNTAVGGPIWSDGIQRFQFERLGYFSADKTTTPGALIFNRTASLKDSWAKDRTST